MRLNKVKVARVLLAFIVIVMTLAPLTLILPSGSTDTAEGEEVNYPPSYPAYSLKFREYGEPEYILPEEETNLPLWWRDSEPRFYLSEGAYRVWVEFAYTETLYSLADSVRAAHKLKTDPFNEEAITVFVMGSSQVCALYEKARIIFPASGYEEIDRDFREMMERSCSLSQEMASYLDHGTGDWESIHDEAEEILILAEKVARDFDFDEGDSGFSI